MLRADNRGFREGRLARFLSPRSIVIADLSERPGSFSERVVDNLCDFEGRLFGVGDPRWLDRFPRVTIVPSLAALPEPPDCVICLRPAAEVARVAAEAAAIGAQGFLTIASGFSEQGSEGGSLQASLSAIGESTGMRILGPNCVGFVNNVIKADCIFQRPVTERRVSPIAIISQPGLGYSLTQRTYVGGGFSLFVGVGNSSDIDLSDLIEHIAYDDTTRSIVCLMESVRDANRFVEVCRLAKANGKTVVAYRTTVDGPASRISQSHIGDVVGSDAAYSAMFRMAGVLLVDRFQDLYETAAFFAKSSPRPVGGVAVLTTSGGAGVLAVKAAGDYGISLPPPSDTTRARLQAVLPSFAAAANPCDVTAAQLQDREIYTRCLEALLADDKFDAVVLPQVLSDPDRTPVRAEELAKLAEETDKSLCVVWLTGWSAGPGYAAYESDERISVFQSLEACFGALAYRASARLSQPLPFKAEVGLTSAGEVHVLDRLAFFGARIESLCWVDLLGVGNRHDGEMLGEELYVVKAIVPGVVHRSALGLVRTHIATIQEAVAAAAEMDIRLRRDGLAPPEGFWMQRQWTGWFELFVGLSRQSGFGPVITIAMGGRDLGRDGRQVHLLAGANESEILAAVDDLLWSEGLSPPANSGSVWKADLVANVIAVVRWALSDPDLIELDLNPMIVSGDGCVIVDAAAYMTPARD